MYVFLPESVTGKVKIGSEARIVLDAAPQYPIRAFVSFVSPMAQFTPKTVETAEERHNLTFRVKLQIDPERLREYEALVKTGLPGMGYVRYDENAPWPESLQTKSRQSAKSLDGDRFQKHELTDRFYARQFRRAGDMTSPTPMGRLSPSTTSASTFPPTR